MSAAVTLLTDGSAPAMVLARWLAGKLDRPSIYEARGAAELGRLLEARRAAMLTERVVVLTESTGPDAGIDGAPATRAVAKWLRDLPPIEARALGGALVEQRLGSDAEGSAQLEELARRLVVVRRKRRGLDAPAVPRRGRPPGSNPFRGVGFDVCVSLLDAPNASWRERALAVRARRDPAAVHRVLAELARRGYLSKGKRGARVTEPQLLRDDLLTVWRGQVGVPRPATELAAHRARAPLEVALRLAARAGRQCLLAGHAALEDDSLRLVGPPTVYLDAPWETVLAEKFEVTTPGVGDLVVWSAPEGGVFLDARQVGGRQATNKVVTYLDLAVADSPRWREAAAQLWKEIAGGE